MAIAGVSTRWDSYKNLAVVLALKVVWTQFERTFIIHRQLVRGVSWEERLWGIGFTWGALST